MFYEMFYPNLYRALYGDAMLELIQILISSNMADRNQQKHLLPSFATYREFTPRGTLNIKVILFLIH